jgi:hypothetical protein
LAYIVGSSGGTYTFSFYVKAKEGESGIWRTRVNGDSTLWQNTQVNDTEWTRVTQTFTKTGSGNIIVYSAYRIDGTSTLFNAYIWGAQLELASYATSYIKTEGSAVTRVAETCEGADVSNIISNQGTLYIEFDYLKETFSSGQYIFALGTDSNNVIWLRKESGANTSTARIRTSSNNQYTESGIDIPTGINKYAVTFSTSGSTIYLNGTEIYSTTSSLTLPAFSTINFNLFSNSGDLFQETKDLRIYNTALTDQELASLTT